MKKYLIGKGGKNLTTKKFYKNGKMKSFLRKFPKGNL